MIWIGVIAIIVLGIIFFVSILNDPKAKQYMDKHRAKQEESEKYTEKLYETFYISDILIDIADGKYDAIILASYADGKNVIMVTKAGGNKTLGYLIEHQPLFKLVESGNGYLEVPLFIITANESNERGKSKKMGYVYIEKIILKDNISDSLDIEDILFDLTEYDDFDDHIELPIKGINFRGLTNVHVGVFDGYIVPDKSNKHDKYALGIYGNDSSHFGFIEKGQKFLHDKVEEKGGIVNVEIEVNTFLDENTQEEKFHGIIIINKINLL